MPQGKNKVNERHHERFYEKFKNRNEEKQLPDSNMVKSVV